MTPTLAQQIVWAKGELRQKARLRARLYPSASPAAIARADEQHRLAEAVLATLQALANKPKPQHRPIRDRYRAAQEHAL